MIGFYLVVSVLIIFFGRVGWGVEGVLFLKYMIFFIYIIIVIIYLLLIVFSYIYS